MRKSSVIGFLVLMGCAGALPGQAATPAPAADPSLAPMAASDLYLGVVEGLIQQQRYEAAIAFLAKYQKSQPLTPRYNKLVGDALLGAGRYDEAVAAYRQALKSNFAAQAYNGIGRALSAGGKWAEAADNFHSAATTDPTNASYLNNFAYAQLKQDFRGPALAPVVSELERAHELDPTSGLIRDNLALALSLSGEHTQLASLLDTIPDVGNRKQLADFTTRWAPAWSDDTGIKETTQ